MQRTRKMTAARGRLTLLGMMILMMALTGAAGASGASNPGAPAGAYSGSVVWEKVPVHGVWANVITVNLNDPRVKVTPAVARSFPRGAESFSGMVALSRPTAAINGTYFCVRTLRPVGDIVIDGEQVYFGGFGTVLAITVDNQARMLDVPRHRHQDWSAYETVMAAGPRLVRDRKLSLDPVAEGYRDPGVYAAARRSAIGITSTGKLRLVTVARPISLRQLARIMLGLDCVQAMALDGGSSSGLYYRGRILQRPVRNLTNLLLVHEADAGRLAMLEHRASISAAMRDLWAMKSAGSDNMAMIGMLSRSGTGLVESPHRSDGEASAGARIPVPDYQAAGVDIATRPDIGSADIIAGIASDRQHRPLIPGSRVLPMESIRGSGGLVLPARGNEPPVSGPARE